MSAVNAFARDDGAWILADTASYRDDGTILNFTGKVAHSSRRRIVIAHTGRVEVDANLNTQRWIAECRSQSEVLATLPGLLEMLADHDAEAQANGAAEASGPIKAGIRMIVAHWDREEKQGRVGILGTTAEMAGGGELFR